MRGTPDESPKIDYPYCSANTEQYVLNQHGNYASGDNCILTEWHWMDQNKRTCIKKSN